MRVAHVIVPRPDAGRPVLEFAWAATRALRTVPDLEIRTVIPVPRAEVRWLQNRARRRKGAAPWPRDLEDRLRGLVPAPELVPFLPRPGASLDAASAAVARALGGWPERWLGSILDEAGYLAARAGARAGRPSVVVAHGTDARTAAAELPSGAAHRARWAARHARRRVAVSNELAGVVAEFAPRPAVVPFTVFAADFPMAPPPAPEPFRWLFVGRLSREKGVDRLLRGLAALDEPGWALELVGPEVRGFDAPALARELGIADRVSFAGSRPQAALSSHYQRAHALALPSRAEGLPNVLVESLCSGRPVIASAVGGIPELVGPEVGVLVRDDDEAAWAMGLRGLMRQAREGRWAPAQLRAEGERWTWEAQAARLAEVIRG